MIEKVAVHVVVVWLMIFFWYGEVFIQVECYHILKTHLSILVHPDQLTIYTQRSAACCETQYAYFTHWVFLNYLILDNVGYTYWSLTRGGEKPRRYFLNEREARKFSKVVVGFLDRNIFLKLEHKCFLNSKLSIMMGIYFNYLTTIKLYNKKLNIMGSFFNGVFLLIIYKANFKKSLRKMRKTLTDYDLQLKNTYFVIINQRSIFIIDHTYSATLRKYLQEFIRFIYIAF